MGISGKFACVFRASATLCRTGVKVVECSAEVDLLVSNPFVLVFLSVLSHVEYLTF